MATAAPEAAAAPAGGGKKKLIMIIAIVLVLVLVGGGAAVMLLKKKPAEGEEGEDGEEPAHKVEVATPKPGTPPVYLPVDPFTVNLADRDVDRFAQVQVSLEVVDQKTADMLKNYMPSIRNGVLMVLSHKTAVELLTREGKEKLQKEIQAEAVRPLGFEVDLSEEAEEEVDAPKKKKKKKKPMALPVTAVLFSQFIVQ
ncbi:flagellar basal body-associated protein FliL [Inhella sp.]|uniref:flagellar basal body-associated FliL family protein n=1 Tax=Inhella sp. TaxID=1921806 RepID=UPI0035ADAD99